MPIDELLIDSRVLEFVERIYNSVTPRQKRELKNSNYSPELMHVISSANSLYIYHESLIKGIYENSGRDDLIKILGEVSKVRGDEQLNHENIACSFQKLSFSIVLSLSLQKGDKSLFRDILQEFVNVVRERNGLDLPVDQDRHYLSTTSVKYP